MEFLLELSKENPKMAERELKSLVDGKVVSFPGFLIVGLENKDLEFLSKRLALTKRIYQVLFSCEEKALVQCIKDFGWNRVYKKNFCVRIRFESGYKERELAGIIWNKLKSPKVNLEGSSTKIIFFKLKDKVYGTLLKMELKQDYLPRKAHKRPELHPSSLHPKLARTLINLTGIKKGALLDPMAGSGGILIEAGLMGLKPVGYDIDKIMVNRARINLDFFKIKGYTLAQIDFFKAKGKIKYLACDLPYGKNTKDKEIGKLYGRFLKKLKNALAGRAVVVFPLFAGKNMDYKSMIKKNNLGIIDSFDYYIHKSLSKRIYILEN